ncbi:MAG: OmpH family outer membrane protein [Bacteroidota bacterium]
MKKYYIFLFLLISGLSVETTYGQDQTEDHKVAFTNIEYLLALLPETQEIEKQLSELQATYAGSLQLKNENFQQQLADYNRKNEQGLWASLQQKQKAESVLGNLQQEIQKYADQAEQKVIQNRALLLEPVMMRLQAAVDKVAIAQGYDYVLNNSIGGGFPTILKGDQSNDITEDLVKELGIKREE